MRETARNPSLPRSEFWCYADGPEMSLNDEIDVQRWPNRGKKAKRAEMELYIPWALAGYLDRSERRIIILFAASICLEEIEFLTAFLTVCSFH